MPGVAIDKMLGALPKTPRLKHLRKTLGTIHAERDKRVKHIGWRQAEPDATLLSNEASSGRKQRVRQRSGRFFK